MVEKRPVSILSLIVRLPLTLLFLFVLYLLGRGSFNLVKGFSLSLGFGDTWTTVIGTAIIVFLVFTGFFAILSYFRNAR